jgi:hypothetical protein
MTSMGPFPQIHPRERIVTEAEQQLRMSIIGLHKLGLTTGEFLQVVTNVMTNEIRMIARHAIRAERHPDDLDKPGGWA